MLQPPWNTSGPCYCSKRKWGKDFYENDEGCAGEQAQGRIRISRAAGAQPGETEVRIKVEACGICHSDVLVKEGLWSGLQYPGVPGTKSPAGLMPLAPEFTTGNPGNGLELAGMAAIVSTVNPVDGDILFCVSP